MKLIYIAGPYRGSCGWEIECNIQAARALGAKVVHAGAYPVIPHSNTSHFDGLATDKFWLAATLELLRRCDGVLFTEDWERSSGARAEHLEAKRLGLPCWHDMHELRGWLAAERARA